MKIKDIIRIDPNKNSKPLFYLRHISSMLFRPCRYEQRVVTLWNMLKSEQKKAVLERVAYYNKLQTPFEVGEWGVSGDEFFKKERKRVYFFDLWSLMRCFERRLRFGYLFGDITTVPEHPSFLKSRPIQKENASSILLKLNSVRHFIFVEDEYRFEDKMDKLVWRGKAYVEHRQEFLKRHHANPLYDIGQTNTKGDLSVPWQKERLSLKEQLRYKFILAIEGNDVASNLKWALSSNSLVFMVRPKYETWFMEGTLKANYHYVELKEDYSDMEEKVRYYMQNPQEASTIIDNAHRFVDKFKNEKMEELIGLLVIEKYFLYSGQIKQSVIEKMEHS